ncbi:hypothetical protein AB0M36_36975 [Actinoplanes sp. NPDC051346]|uniref:hypothetical protein n=1 Tax=Actinoplanes sp. NPDC051346 TaxID=3155048 RepID=UPI003413039F
MSTLYRGFLPQHTSSTHRVFAVVDHGDGETVQALATFPTAQRANTVTDLLNLLAAGYPPEGTRERLVAALDAEPGPVRASVTAILDVLESNPYALTLDLRRRETAGFASFLITGCPEGGCGTCTACGDDCLDCPACDTDGCGTCIAPVITPRTALLLHAAGDILSDEIRMAVEDPDGWDAFPPFFSHLSAVAVDGFRSAFLDLAADLAHGVEPHPRTMAEEIALHLMTDRAQVDLELGVFDDELKQLPESSADYDWEAILDVLYQDSDYVGLMGNPGKLHAKTVVALFERFNNMPERPYTSPS